MTTRQRGWQRYWYDLRFRRQGTQAFVPMAPGGLQPVPSAWLANGPVDEFAEWFLTECVDELDDLRGELRLLIYTEATPGPTVDPVLMRTIEIGRH